MEAQIHVVGGDELQELVALREWLQDEDELRGAAATVTAPIRETELGGVLDMVTVAVGSSGVGLALSRSLTTWLRSRRSNVKLSVSTGDRMVEIEATNLDQALPLLQEALRADDES